MGDFMKDKKWDASFQDTMLKIVRALPQFLKYLLECCYLLFLAVLKDQFPDVWLNIITKLASVNDIIGMNRPSRSLLLGSVNLASWRVRWTILN